MSDGNFRLRWPDQMISVSESAKPLIIADHNVMRYNLQSVEQTKLAGHASILILK